MKELTFLGNLFLIISFILLCFVGNFSFIYVFIMFLCLSVLMYGVLKKRVDVCLFIYFPLGYFSLALLTLEVGVFTNVLRGIYFVSFFLSILYWYYYIYDKSRNKNSLVVNNFNIKDENYLVGKLVMGFNSYGVCALIKRKDGYVFKIESKKRVKTHFVKFSDILKIRTEVKPYIVSNDVMVEAETDFMHLYITGVARKYPESVIFSKKMKPVKSWHVKMRLVSGHVIKMIFFNEPSSIL